MSNTKSLHTADTKRYSSLNRIHSEFKRNYQMYLLCLPAIIYLIIFNYFPMYGVQLAFKDFIAIDGIKGSLWVGLKHFNRFFSSYNAVWVNLLNPGTELLLNNSSAIIIGIGKSIKSWYKLSMTVFDMSMVDV